jgi:hypothetical protein
VREAVGIDVRHVPGSDVENQDPVVGVGEGESRAVGRPRRDEEERRVGNIDAALTPTVLVSYDEAILAALVAEPGDLRPVRRPDRVTVGDAGCACKVAPRPLVGRHAEDLASPFEQRALAGR